MEYNHEKKPYKTWAVMAMEEEDEDLREEQERERLENEKLRILVNFRKYLYSIGRYELEDWEIL